MKKILLPILVLIGTSALAQVCVPNAVVGTGASYILPDTTTNFADGCVNEAYLQYVYLKVPQDTTFPVIGNVTIDSFVINKNVTGLPLGLIIESNPAILPAAPPNLKTNFERMKVKGDSLGCIKFSGIILSPVGVYNLVIPIRAYGKIAGIIPIDSALNLTSYKINVKAPSTCFPASISNLDAYQFNLIGAIPNPANGQTQIQFQASKENNFILKITNALGQIVLEKSIKSIVGKNYYNLDASNWAIGTYLYSLSDGKNIISKKLQLR